MNRARARRPQQDLDDAQQEEGLNFGGADSALMGGTFGNAFALEQLRQRRDGDTSEEDFPFQREAEAVFGEALSDITFETGQRSSLNAVGADATAEGDTLRFAESVPDKETVMHEVAHVVQSRRSGGGEEGALSNPDQGAEKEAESAAKKAVRGESVDVKARPEAGVMRKKSKHNVLPEENLTGKKIDTADLRKKESNGQTVTDYSKQVKAGGKEICTSAEAEMFRGDGASMGLRVREGTPITLLTGQRKSMRLNKQDPATDVVLAWGVPISKTTFSGPVPSNESDRYLTGWVAVDQLGDALPGAAPGQPEGDAAVRATLRDEGKIGGAATKKRKGDQGALTHKIKAEQAPQEFKDARISSTGDLDVLPRTENSGSNLAEHYFARAGGTVNLLLNVPQSGDDRLGTAVDLASAGQHFQFAEMSPVMVWSYRPKTQWHKKTPSGPKNDPVKPGRPLRFVYGKVVELGRWGWINHRLVS